MNDILSTLQYWEDAGITARVVASATISGAATLIGCIVVRWLWSASYDKLIMLWLFVGWGFFCLNLVFINGNVSWPQNILLSMLAVLVPSISYFSYGMHEPRPDNAKQ